jgi:type IV secretory pathway VirB10-like protein
VFRRVKSLAIKPDTAAVKATVPSKVADYLLNNMRSLIVAVEEQYQTRVSVMSREYMCDNEITVEGIKKEPTELISTEPDLAPSPPPEDAAAPENESKAEAEPRRSRRPARRRRRSRKKSPAESPEETTPIEAVLDQAPAVALLESAELVAERTNHRDNDSEIPADSGAEREETSLDADDPSSNRFSVLRRYFPFLL